MKRHMEGWMGKVGGGGGISEGEQLMQRHRV